MIKTPINDLSSTEGLHTQTVTMPSTQIIDIKEAAFKQSRRCHSENKDMVIKIYGKE